MNVLAFFLSFFLILIFLLFSRWKGARGDSAMGEWPYGLRMILWNSGVPPLNVPRRTSRTHKYLT